jgi:hypothetical protein
MSRNSDAAVFAADTLAFFTYLFSVVIADASMRVASPAAFIPLFRRHFKKSISFDSVPS